MPSSHLILHRPLLLPSIPPSVRVFSNVSTLRMRWPKYWSFSFSISPSKEHPGLISFRMDWLDLLAVQGTLKSLLQHHSSKISILRCSALLKKNQLYSFQEKNFILTSFLWFYRISWPSCVKSSFLSVVIVLSLNYRPNSVQIYLDIRADQLIIKKLGLSP